MKVTVKDYLNVRVGSPSLNAPTYQYLAPGSEIEVDGNLYEGQEYEGKTKWLKDEGGNYYWAGGVENSLKLETEGKIFFWWFRDLNIKTIWNRYNVKGESVSIAVLDSGYNIKNDDIEVEHLDTEVGINYNNFCDEINDLSGHGTRCISIINAKNKFQYNLGISPSSRILIYKINCQGEETDMNIILNGIEWAVNHGAEVISISQAFPIKNESQRIDYQNRLTNILIGKNVLIFAASGNNAITDGSPYFADYYPASFNECISVGGTDHQGKFSNITIQSTRTVIHAPAIKIESYGLEDYPTQADGTSFSTPIVAGIAALAISYRKRTNKPWSSEYIKNKLYQTGTPLGLSDKKIINPLKLFQTL